MIQLDDFRDANQQLISKNEEIRVTMPNQIDDAEAVTIEGIATTAAASVGFAFSFDFILNLFLKSSMHTILGAIKNLQVIVHLGLLHVVVPANAAIFYSKV